VDMTISIGNLLTIAAFLVGGIGFVYTIRADVRSQGDRISSVEDEIKEIKTVVVAQARNEERLNAMDRRIDDLRRGRGFITEDWPQPPPGTRGKS